MKKEITRTDFIRKCGVYCVGGLTLSTLLESCGTSNYFAASTVDANKVIINKSEFTYTIKEEEKQRRFVLVKNAKLEFPIGVYKFDNGEYKALYLQCTHQGCEVQPYNDYLVCPCHGSEFTNKGKVTSAPAETDLKQFAVAVEGDRIIIVL
jgi:Rieske Fe-S protein